MAGILPALFGDGTAAHPDAGIISGSGFSYDALTCPGTNACNGGKAGLLAGRAGNGWNGGSGRRGLVRQWWQRRKGNPGR